MIALALLFSLHIQFLPHGHYAFTIRCGPQDDGRVLILSVVSDDYERTSQTTVEPSKTSSTVRVEWREIPNGEYVVRAVLLDRNGKVISSASSPLLVFR